LVRKLLATDIHSKLWMVKEMSSNVVVGQL